MPDLAIIDHFDRSGWLSFTLVSLNTWVSLQPIISLSSIKCWYNLFRGSQIYHCQTLYSCYVTTHQTACKADKAVFGQMRTKLCIEFLHRFVFFPRTHLQFELKILYMSHKGMIYSLLAFLVVKDHRNKTLSAKKKKLMPWYAACCSFCFSIANTIAQVGIILFYRLHYIVWPLML